jgi:hypothetical protein
MCDVTARHTAATRGKIAPTSTEPSVVERREKR